MKAMLLTAAFCAALTVAGTAQAKPLKIAVTMENYAGWSGAQRLSNGKVDVVVVPQIGRVMAFHFTGQPESNVFFQNPAFLGKPVSTDAATQWANFGGDKLWPAPQADWPKHAPVAWPPEAQIDSGPYIATEIKNGVKLVGPVSPSFGGRFVREITLKPNRADVFLRDTFEKTGGQAFPIGIWSVTQVMGDASVYLPQNANSIFGAAGMTSLTDAPGLPANAISQDGMIVVTRDPANASKIGADTTGGWIACVKGDVLFSERFMRAKGTYPDKNSNAEVYTNPGDLAYIEMEVLAPLADLKLGQKTTRAMSWRLQKLPRVPTSPADERALVKAAMSHK